MREVIGHIARWRERGDAVATATIVGIAGSSPRELGALLAVNERGEFAGSLSGGCVDGAVVDEAMAVLASGSGKLLRYTANDGDPFSVGLTCGGELEVYVEPVDDLFEEIARAIETETPLAIAVRLDAAMIGKRLIVDSQGRRGTLGSPGLDYAVGAELEARTESGAVDRRHYGDRGEPLGTEAAIFVRTFGPRARMVLAGAVDFARPLARLGTMLGYKVTIVDARSAFATRERFPDADEIVVMWPDAYLDANPLGADAVCVVLTHEEKFDIPLLASALRSPAVYVGAMGSRSTHAKRMAQLRAEGLSEAEIARLASPVGLDLGGRTPEETAISIAAEIVALRHNRGGGRLTGGSRALHPQEETPLVQQIVR
jgi:xanthine dehydrogenase accessory factor